MNREQGGKFMFCMPDDEDLFNLFPKYFGQNMDRIDQALGNLEYEYDKILDGEYKYPITEYQKYLDALYKLITSDMVSIELTDKELEDCIAKEHYTQSKYYVASAYSVTSAYVDLITFIRKMETSSIKEDNRLKSGKSLNELLFSNI